MSNRGRKKANRPRSTGNRGAKWALLIALALLVALVVLLARLTAERHSQPSESAGPTDTRSVKKPAEKPPVSPDSEFQFYTLLPEEGNQPPPAAQPEEEAPPAPPQPALDADARYLIQAGSFHDADDAEARKASLALLGVESRVTAATVDGRRYHRVVLGPIAGKDVPSVRRQLEEAGIESTPPRRVPD